MYSSNLVRGAGRPLTSDEIDDVERQIGIALPPSLRKHYSEYDGGMLELSTFVADNGDDFDFGSFLSMKSRRYPHESLFGETYRRIVLEKMLVPAAYVPFAVDGGGNFFAMGRDDGGIYYFAMDVPDAPMAADKVADGLVQFVVGMSESP